MTEPPDAPAPADSGLLDGVRVLDLSKLIPGAATAGALAALGADVVKVEQPEGDYLRRVPPLVHGHGILGATLDAGKRSVVVDRFADGSAEVLTRLAANVDVVVESSRPGVMERDGLDGIALVASGLVVAHVSAFGRDGPLSSLPAHGLNLDAPAGLAFSNPNGTVADGWMPISVLAGPLFAATGIAAALWRRERSGRGSELDVSCFEAGVFWQQMLGAPYWNDGVTGAIPLHGGDPKARYSMYDTADGHRVAFCAIEPRFFEAFCRDIGREDLLVENPDDSEFDFGAEEAELRAELEQIFVSRSRAEWADVFVRADVAAAPVYEPEEIPDTPQAVARGAVRTVTMADGVVVRVPAWPVREVGIERPACDRHPAVGEHTEAVLTEAGFSPDEQETLAAGGLIRPR